MERKLFIFLDFDGVLNSANWALERQESGSPVDMGRELDRRCIEHLNTIISRTGAKVVVSSYWRLGRTVDQLQSLLNEHGFIGEVIDKTPEFRDPNTQRGHEIAWWMQKNGVDNPMDIVILDDNTDMAHLKHRLMQTSFMSWGLTKVHALAAADMFDRDTSWLQD